VDDAHKKPPRPPSLRHVRRRVLAYVAVMASAITIFSFMETMWMRSSSSLIG
jgi:hypothetical protein